MKYIIHFCCTYVKSSIIFKFSAPFNRCLYFKSVLFLIGWMKINSIQMTTQLIKWFYLYSFYFCLFFRNISNHNIISEAQFSEIKSSECWINWSIVEIKFFIILAYINAKWDSCVLLCSTEAGTSMKHGLETYDNA